MPVQRTISTLGLLLASISAIIGSGWLFSAYYAATLAGPAAILSWVIGGIIVIIIAFVFAEICAMLPITGSSSRIPQYTHGTLVSFTFAWMIWLSYLAVIPAETQAVIQYSSFYFPNLVYPGGRLTHYGYAVATLLMLLIAIINTYSIRWLIRVNNILTILKLIIPLVIVVYILYLYFKPEHIFHPLGSQFMPLGMKSVFAAIITGGIVFAFNGFKQAAEMAGEAKRPHISVPIAIVGSVLACLILFLLIELAFFSSLNPSNLMMGWMHLHLNNNNSPIAAIIMQDKASRLLPLLYFTAIIAPLAAGLMYCSSAARSLYGMATNGYVPAVLGQLTPQGNPVAAIMVNFIIGMCFFAPLPGWENIATFLSSLFAMTYVIGPVTLIALRKQMPERHRPLRLPFGKIWATVAFYLCTLLAYWSGWPILSKMLCAVFLGLVILLLYLVLSRRKIKLNVSASLWLWPYLIGLGVISYFGDYGGIGRFSLWTSMVILLLFCVVIMWLALKLSLPAAQTRAYIDKLQLEHAAKART